MTQSARLSRRALIMSTFHLVVASVGETHFDGEAQSATLPGSAGEFTILAHHEPLVTTLAEGVITVRLSTEAGQSGTKEINIKSGILECSNNRAVVLL